MTEQPETNISEPYMSQPIPDGSKLTFPYDDKSPFGTYRLSRKHKLFYSLFRRKLLPRGSVWRAYFKSQLETHGSEILDVSIDGINLRMKPLLNSIEQTYLRNGKQYYDAQERKALTIACNSVENPVFIDLGANIGLYSLLLAKSVPKLQVVALEPHPGIRKQLDYNLSLNSGHNISVHECAISDQTDWVWMQTREDNGQSRIEEKGDVRVKCMTLLELVNRENLDHIEAIKIDVEGYEDKALYPFFRDAHDSLLPKVIVVEVFLSKFWNKDIIKVAMTRGYKEIKLNHMNSILLRD